MRSIFAIIEGIVKLKGQGGAKITSTTDGAKERLDIGNAPGHAMVDLAGIRAVNSLFGDAIVAERQADVAVSFAHGRPSEILTWTERWNLSSVSGPFTVGEMVSGGTSNASAYIDVTSSPAQLQGIEGALLEGETITGVASGETAVINRGSNAFSETTDSNLIVESGVLAVNDHFIRSRTMSPYQSGFASAGLWTASWPDGSAVGTDLWVGLLSEDDGYAVGFKDENWGILHRRGGSEAAFVLPADFSIDPLDGSGPSGYDIDTTLSNAFYVQYGYLGAVGALYNLVMDDMSLVPFHKISRINSSTQTVLRDPQLPISAQIVRRSGTVNKRIFSGSWAAGSIGPAKRRRRKFTVPATASPTGTEISFLSLQNKRVHHGIQGRAPMRLISLYLTNIGGAATTLRIRRNATFVTGTPTYVDVDALNSISEFDDSSTLTIAGGKIDQQIPIPPDSGERFDLRIDDLELRPGDSYTFSVEKGPGSSPDASVSVRWEEDL